MQPTAAQVRKLNDALLQLRVQEGFDLLDKCNDGEGLDPCHPCAPAYLLCMAQWVDVGYRNLECLDSLIAAFTKVDRAQLPLCHYASVCMAEGYRSFASENTTKAIAIFDFVLRIERGLLDPQTIAFAHFWLGRAHRKQGEYELALQHIIEGRALALKLKAPKLIASIKIHEGWLMFQRGQRKDAIRLLDEAESELETTGHVLALGNIASARGRFARRGGEYEKALNYFESAIHTYGKRYPHHPNLARALVNAAYVKRLMALDMKTRSSGKASGAQHSRYLEICRQALGLLKRAEKIYDASHHRAGVGTVFVNASHLHLDSGDIDKAEAEAAKAYHLGRRTQDHILMARARTLQAAIERDRAEEQMGEFTDTARHANTARVYADEAIEIAQSTQNKRLLAGAYLARGMTAACEFFQEWDLAKHFATLAAELLSKDDRDHLTRELSQLKQHILQRAGINDTLRTWSEGAVHNKRFQQLVEEFAEIVIPKVWAREGYKISRVAAELSISPKKVRRVLANANLLRGGDAANAKRGQ